MRTFIVALMLNRYRYTEIHPENICIRNGNVGCLKSSIHRNCRNRLDCKQTSCFSNEATLPITTEPPQRTRQHVQIGSRFYERSFRRNILWPKKFRLELSDVTCEASMRIRNLCTIAKQVPKSAVCVCHR